MKTLTVDDHVVEAEYIIKGSDYILGLNINKEYLFKFTNIVDFSTFKLGEGQEWDPPLPKELIKASDIGITPIDGVTAINVDEALKEAFLVSSEIIKSVANSLGGNITATESHTTLKVKLHELQLKFTDALKHHSISIDDIKNIHDLIEQVKGISRLHHTEYIEVTEPIDFKLDRKNVTSIDTMCVSVLELLRGTISELLYYNEFKEADIDRLIDSTHVIKGSSGISLRENYLLKMTKDRVDNYKDKSLNVYTLDTKQFDINELTKFKIEHNQSFGVDWIDTHMTSENTPRPRTVSSSEYDVANSDPTWCIFDRNKTNSNWRNKTVLSTAIQMNFGKNISVDHIMISINKVNGGFVNAPRSVYVTFRDYYDKSLGTFNLPFDDWDMSSAITMKFKKVVNARSVNVLIDSNYGGSYTSLSKIMFGITRENNNSVVL